MSHFPLVSLKIKMLKAKGMEKEEGHSFPIHRLGYGLGKGLFHTWKEPCFSGFIKLQGRGNVYSVLKSEDVYPLLDMKWDLHHIRNYPDL